MYLVASFLLAGKNCCLFVHISNGYGQGHSILTFVWRFGSGLGGGGFNCYARTASIRVRSDISLIVMSLWYLRQTPCSRSVAIVDEHIIQPPAITLLRLLKSLSCTLSISQMRATLNYRLLSYHSSFNLPSFCKRGICRNVPLRNQITR